MAKDNLVLISAGRWIYAVSSIDGAISWGKEISRDGYVLFFSVIMFSMEDTTWTLTLTSLQIRNQTSSPVT
jgi:hypothetical protein